MLQLAHNPASIAHLKETAAQRMSIVNSDIALARPIAEIIEATLTAAGNSAQTHRSYLAGLALFLEYLQRQRGNLAAVEFTVIKWVDDTAHNPSDNTGRRKTRYDFGGTPAAWLLFVDAGLLSGFAAWLLSEIGNSPNTASIRVNQVTTFLRVALRENVLTQEQAKNMGLKPYTRRNKRDQKPAGRRLSNQEAQALLSAPDQETLIGKRDYAIIALGLFQGLRQAEIAGLTRGDLMKHNGRHVIHVTGKGNKTRRLYLHPATKAAINAWLKEAEADADQDNSTPVFLTLDRWGNTRQGITPTDVSRTVRRLAKAAGLGKVASHDLRRTFARNAYDHSRNLLLVQRELDHADPSTTAHYIGLEEGDGETAVDFVSYDD